MIFAFWFHAVVIGVTLVNAAIQYRRHKKQEEEAEKARLDSMSDPAIPHTSEGDVIPVVFGTVKLTGPNVVGVTLDENGHAHPETRTLGDNDFSSIHALRLHLVFCQGPVNAVTRFESGEKRLHELEFGEKTPVNDVVSEWDLLEHYDTENESIYQIDENKGPMFIRIDSDDDNDFGIHKGGLSWHNFRWLGGWPDQDIDLWLDRWMADEEHSDHLPPEVLRDIPAYRGLFGCTGRAIWELGKQMDPVSVTVRRTTVGSFGRDLQNELSSGWALSPTADDMNGAAIVEEILTDDQWGAGIDGVLISDRHFDYAATQAQGLSFVWADRIEIAEMIGEVLRHIDGALYVEPTTGEFVLRLIRDDYDLDTMEQAAGDFEDKDIITLTPDDIESVREDTPSTKELVNELTVTWPDRRLDRSRSITEHDTAAQLFRGAVEKEVQFPMIGDSETASELAARELNELGQPLRSFEIDLHADAAKDIRPVDVFVLVWPDYGIEQMLCRVVGYHLSDPTEQMITIEAVQDAFAVSEAITTIPSDIDVPPLTQDPEPAEEVMATESPFWWEYERQRQEEWSGVVPSDIADLHRGHAMLAAYTSQAGAFNFDAQFIPGGIDEAIEFTAHVGMGFNAEVNDISTAGEFVDLGNFDPQPGETHAFFEVDEGVIVAAKNWNLSTNAAQFEVGWFDTTPNFPTLNVSGSFLVIAYGQYVDGQMQLRRATGHSDESISSTEVDCYALVRNYQGRLDTEEVDDPPKVTIDLRRRRPYPPGNLDVDDSQDDDQGLDGHLAYSWALRDRLQKQTDQSDSNDFDPGPDIQWRVNIWSVDAGFNLQHHLLDDHVEAHNSTDYQWDNVDEADAMESATGQRQLADRLLFIIEGEDTSSSGDLRSWQENQIFYDRT